MSSKIYLDIHIHASGNIAPRVLIYLSVKVFGNFTIILTCKSPNWSGYPLSGIPSPLTIFQESGYIISFGSLLIVTILPSKWVRVFSKPKSDSWRFKVISKNKLFPTLLKVGCGFCLTVKTKSPLAISGTYSASFALTWVSPWAVPGSKSKSTYVLLDTNLFPLHPLHLAAID